MSVGFKRATGGVEDGANKRPTRSLHATATCKMSETPFAATDVPATDAHEIRITSSGKIQSWVEFALKFFEVRYSTHIKTAPPKEVKENEDRPLVFHTMPAEPRPEPTEQPDPPKPPAERNANKLHPSLALVPRLVSVAEIVKREYVKLLDTSLAEQGCLSGLHQYNEIVHLDVAASQAGPTDAEEQRLEALTHALQGRKK